jgi:hypothetical protein
MEFKKLMSDLEKEAVQHGNYRSAHIFFVLKDEFNDIKNALLWLDCQAKKIFQPVELKTIAIKLMHLLSKYEDNRPNSINTIN